MPSLDEKNKGTDAKKHLPYDSFNKVGQRAANYRPATDLKSSCGVCQHFSPSYDGGGGECMLVAGHVSGDYVSDLFVPLGDPTSSAKAMPFRQEFQIAKAVDWQQNVFGWANVSMVEVGKEYGLLVDHQSDVIVPELLESAAYQFVLDFRDAGEMHKGAAKGKLIESMVFTEEKLEKFATDDDGSVNDAHLSVLKERLPLGWWTGFHLDDLDTFEKVKKGEYEMFSIQGVAWSHQVEVGTDA